MEVRHSFNILFYRNPLNWDVALKPKNSGISAINIEILINLIKI